MSNHWSSLLRKPANLSSAKGAQDWFTQIATQLLNNSQLLVGGEPHRLTEIEFYFCGSGHPDPFTHCDPLQKESGRWYFHRSRGIYKGGNFKGLDLTFGDGADFGGVLIRGMETADGTLIDGPSLCVDHLLEKSAAGDVALLDKVIAGRPAWDPSSPLVLREVPEGETRQLYCSGRIGLSLKSSRPTPDRTRYILRPYRFLTEPRRVSKGKAYLVLALHSQGHDPSSIKQLTGCPAASIARYLADFEAGALQTDFASYYGADLGPKELCKLHGTWHASWGKSDHA